MADIIWTDISEESKKKIQGYVAGITTEGNPDLPATGPGGNKKALATQNKIITLAINELLSTATIAKNATTSFSTRFNDILGDETLPGGFADLTALKAIADNITKAVLDIHATTVTLAAKLDSTEQTAVEAAASAGAITMGAVTLDELLNQYPLTVTFSNDNSQGGWKFLGEKNWRPAGTVQNLDEGEYTLVFKFLSGYRAIPNKVITLTSDVATHLVSIAYEEETPAP